jgi:MiaB-like tRNA modifying enzyme
MIVMKIFIETYGCTYNQADSQIMKAQLEEEGFKLVDNLEKAEIIIINTCYVKKPTEQKIINRLNFLLRDFPEKKFIIAGCMVDIDPERLEKINRHVSWIGPHHVTSVTKVVKNLEHGKITRLTGTSKILKAGIPKKRDNPLIHIIQIAEGCSGLCSYCCTRFARGNLQSYSISALRDEVEIALEEGVKEIQLTAQDTAAFGMDTGETLSDLINEICVLDGDFRIRVGMMHPQNLLRDINPLIESFAQENVYKFLHLPVQSGNNGVLKDMGRGYSYEQVLWIVNIFKRKIPNLALATDIIVGYPTEDNMAFQDTLEMVRKVKPDFLHISKYHHRPGAISSQLKEISYKEMKKRSKVLNQLKTDLALKNNEELLNTFQQVLITSKGSKGGYVGRTNSYKTVILPEAKLGSFQNVKITESKSTYLIGKQSY